MSLLSLRNPLLVIDSYKASHYLQYPPDADGLFAYVEARGGSGEHDRTVFFGLQALLGEYLSTPITNAMIDEAGALLTAHGEPFNEAGWRKVVREHAGHLPLTIRAVPEGSVVPVRNALVTVECTDPDLYWLVTYIETWLLRLWYPVTVATRSWHLRGLIARYLAETADDASGLPFKLHDFGARGVSSGESAALGGLGHLVNFQGTDTVEALLAARYYYDTPMAGFSIPAAEHSTMTAWGRENEETAYRHMLQRFGQPGGIFACVSDSYDLWHALALWGGPLREAVKASGATLVIRPDSGDPVEVVGHACRVLADHFGTTVNRRGYHVLNTVRLIQGDGISPASIEAILARLKADGFSADNIAFGMGGGLLQQLNRDTAGFAMKCSAVRRQERWHDIYKSPVTDPGKASRKGRLTTLHKGGAWQTVRLEEAAALQTEGWQEALRPVYVHGRLCVRDTLEVIRARAAAAHGA